MTIPEYLLSIGWKPDERGDFDSPGFDYHVDLNSCNGFAWELCRFDDSDRDGVATAQWRRMDIEGDSLADLIVALDGLK